MALNYATMGGPTTTTTTAAHMYFRSEMGYTELEKRRLFLRSYQFSRKQSLAERIKKSFFRVRKVIWVRFRSARKLRKMLWLKLKNGIFFAARRKRFFLRLNYHHGGCSSKGSSCFW